MTDSCKLVGVSKGAPLTSVANRTDVKGHRGTAPLTAFGKRHLEICCDDEGQGRFTSPGIQGDTEEQGPAAGPRVARWKRVADIRCLRKRARRAAFRPTREQKTEDNTVYTVLKIARCTRRPNAIVRLNKAGG